MSAPEDEDEDWIARSLSRARHEVATWPQWKKDAFRVLPDPPVASQASASSPGNATADAPDWSNGENTQMLGLMNVLHAIGPYVADLNRQRVQLLRKEMTGEITAAERRHLGMVRWQLDLFELARLEPNLHMLRNEAERHARIAESVSELIKALASCGIY